MCLWHRSYRWSNRNLHVLIMCYVDKPFFMIRRSKSHWYKGASGTSGATPKLYSKGQAEAWCKKFNERPAHHDVGPWEVVPVSLMFGLPYTPE